MARTAPGEGPARTLALHPARAGVARAYAPVLVIAILLAGVPLAVGDNRFYMTLAINGLTFAAYAVAFNLLFGATNQLFLCLGALAGVSAYGSSILGNEFGWPLALTIPIGVLAAAGLGGLFSWVAVRRRLDVIFIGIVTLAFTLMFTNMLQGFSALTGGETGLRIDAGEGTFLRSSVAFYALMVVVVCGFLTVYRLLERSHHGWAFRALTDDQLAAELAGVDVARYRITAGVIAGAMLGLTGALYAAHEGFVSPRTFDFGDVDVRTLVMLAFGGIGTMTGPVVGAAAVTVIDLFLRPLGQLRLLVYGVLLIGLFLGFRRGLVPAVTGAVSRLVAGRARAG
ncbi:MAG: branched-chain amino acid ABC transporter permease [Nitriliruptoraceae bacterium]|nr:branched-chain amino acid ABC transporter permease [Nitriliruptoraceae bacterium]